MQIKVSVVGTPPQEFIQKLKLLNIQSKEAVIALGEATKEHMKEVITSSVVRPGSTGKLANSIEVEEIINGVGVGNIDKMEKGDAPHWAAVNFGSDHMVGRQLPLGTFSPGIPRPTMEDFRGGRWTKESQGGSRYSPIVTKPILAMNYIEQTANWLATVWKVSFSKALNVTKIFYT